MRFRALFLSTLALSVLLGACGDVQRDLYKADYQGWMDKVNTPAAIDRNQLDGVWMLGAEGYLYRDKFDERYDAANGRTAKKSGEMLLIHGGKMAKGTVRLGCPPPNEKIDATWMVETGYTKGDAEHSLALDIPAFMTAAMTRAEKHWMPFDLTGQALDTKSRKLRGIGDGEKAEVVNYVMRVTELNSHRLEIAYIHPAQIEGGVHTIIEIYRRLEGREFLDILKESSDLKPCEVPK